MSDNERVARGHRAMNELHEVAAAFDAVEAAIVKAMLETSPANVEKILTLHRAAQTIEAVKAAMQRVIDDGAMASSAIAQEGLTRN